MKTLSELFSHFFTHKDFLPPASEIAGTLFTPLHFICAGILLVLLVTTAVWVAKRREKTIRTVFLVIWLATLILEPTKIVWETLSGASHNFEWGGILPLYPCSIFMYAMPFVIFGRGRLRYMGCGYVCTLGLLGAAVNFFYPANILSNYSCLSFAGFHTFFFHGAILFCALVMLISGYHSYKSAKTVWDLLLPALPALAVSVVANLVNFSKIGSDYMFFKLNSFFMAPLGALLPDAVSVLLVYAIYLFIHALPYLPCYIRHRLLTARGLHASHVLQENNSERKNKEDPIIERDRITH
ncbi:MAG: YwaF family protein [Clostridia bacterium]|nr:YwaF family protein [Clostridia bacterium]